MIDKIGLNQNLRAIAIPTYLELPPPPLLCLPLCRRRSLQDALEGGHGGVCAERPPHDARARTSALDRRATRLTITYSGYIKNSSRGPQRVGIGQNWVNGTNYVKFDFQQDGHIIFALRGPRMEKFRILSWSFRWAFLSGSHPRLARLSG